MKNNLKARYRLTIEKSLVISLCLIIILFLLFPLYKHKTSKPRNIVLDIVVENIPITRQGKYRPPPPKPAVPIPEEEDIVPEDETIEKTDLDLQHFQYTTFGKEKGIVAPAYNPPRPVAEVFPEYPEEDYKKGVTGIVKLHVKVNKKGRVVEVVVLENTTNSKRCAEAAIKAAYQGRYFPATQNKKPISCWTTRIIKFDIPQ